MALSLLGTLTACGHADMHKFLGDWASVGEEVQNCGGLQISKVSLNGHVTIAQGPESGQLTTLTPFGCHLNWTVDGIKASLINLTPPGPWQGCGPNGGPPYCPQQCRESSGERSWDTTIDSGTLILDGNVITYAIQGSAGNRQFRMVRTCDLTQSGTFARD
jgi:hypothetical protein